jgi:deoxyribodipyrimidine photo-lyase
MATVLVWLRRDLRLEDHPALAAAFAAGLAPIPVYLWSPEEEGTWAPGAASRSWLRRSLLSLEADLRRRGSRLVVRRGPAGQALQDMLRETGAVGVFWNRRYESVAMRRDAEIKEQLLAAGLEARSFSSATLFAPNRVANQAGKPFQVFTPFWKHCRTLPIVEAAPALPAAEWPQPDRWPSSLSIDDLGLAPNRPWDAAFFDPPEPGESGAHRELDRFVQGALHRYQRGRDMMAEEGTSRLSPRLAFGELSPGQVWRAAQPLAIGSDGETYLRELGWREFAYHLLFHFPDTPTQPLRPEFAAFPWRDDPVRLRAWQRGQTGYPLVDAGMRQLWATGWMHNRARMVVGSFLVKHLLQPWQRGAEWFWDTLVDADLASNTLGWQWVGGCGADAAPYFRVFNPVLQGLKFDPEGVYVRRWVPELAGLAAPWVHQPWEAPAEILRNAGVQLGGNYPHPLVESKTAREQALAAYSQMKASAS